MELRIVVILLDKMLAFLDQLNTADYAFVLGFLRSLLQAAVSTDEDEQLEMARLLSRAGMEEAARKLARGPAPTP